MLIAVTVSNVAHWLVSSLSIVLTFLCRIEQNSTTTSAGAGEPSWREKESSDNLQDTSAANAQVNAYSQYSRCDRCIWLVQLSICMVVYSLQSLCEVQQHRIFIVHIAIMFLHGICFGGLSYVVMYSSKDISIQ